jgi:hypothetical protein
MINEIFLESKSKFEVFIKTQGLDKSHNVDLSTNSAGYYINQTTLLMHLAFNSGMVQGIADARKAVRM